jgi:hypothetical protein
MIPCSVDAIKLCVGFWHHVVNSNPDCLINQMYVNLRFGNMFSLSEYNVL